MPVNFQVFQCQLSFRCYLYETRLEQGILNSEIYIPGYEIVRHDRNRNGGGVCFYIKTAINYSVRTDLNINNLENLF